MTSQSFVSPPLTTPEKRNPEDQVAPPCSTSLNNNDPRGHLELEELRCRPSAGSAGSGVPVKLCCCHLMGNAAALLKDQCPIKAAQSNLVAMIEVLNCLSKIRW